MRKTGALAEPKLEVPTADNKPRTVRIDEATGMQFEDVRCPKHGSWYVRAYIRRLNLSTGSCEKCQAEEALELQARALLPKRASEIAARVQTALSEAEDQISEQVEAEIAAYVDEIRPQFEAGVRANFHEHFRMAVEDEIVEQIKAELEAAQ